MTQATPKDYWISPSALHIELNALGDPDYIQASCVSGAQILVYVKDIIGYDAGHNYRRWLLQAAPTVFNSHAEKYVYAAIPRDMTLAASAWIVFPSEVIDIYGKNEKEEQIGDEKYYYINLQGVITSSGDNGTVQRDWKPRISTGYLSSDEAISAVVNETEWYKYSNVDELVTFLKDLTMKEGTKFQKLFANFINVLPKGSLSFDGQGAVTGIADPLSTPDASTDKIVTPDFVRNRAISKLSDDTAKGLISFRKGLEVGNYMSGAQGGFIDSEGNAELLLLLLRQALHVIGDAEVGGAAKVRGLLSLLSGVESENFIDSMTAGHGWQIDNDGNAQVESIEVRSYMRVLELVMNRLSAEESEFIFTESGTVETATPNEDDGTYTLVMRKKTDKDITAFQVGDVLKGVVNDLAEPGAVGVKYYTSWVQVKEVNQTDNSIKVAVYADDETPAKKNFPPCELMVLHRWGNADETKKERQSCWYISSIEKRIVMLDGITQPITTDENLASFYGLPFDMETFKGYSLNKNQPYLYVRGAFLQDVCFIDYLGKVVKQERYRGVWSQEVANGKDPYIVTQTTFDTVYHKNAKWQCSSTSATGTNVEPSENTTDWVKLTDGGEAITVESTDVYYCLYSRGDDIPNDNYEGWTNAIIPTPTEKKPYLWTRTRWYFSDGTITPTYTVVRFGQDGKPGKNLTKVTNYYKWGTRGDTAPADDFIPDAIPPHSDGYNYLWNYEVCSDDDGVEISRSGKTCIGYFPKDGEPGKGIASITEYYQIGTERKPAAISVSTDGTTVTIPSGWKTTMDTTTPDKRYVWNQEVIKYSDGTYSVTAVHLAGAQGDQGDKGDKGDQGDKGEDGNGMEYIYMRTEGYKVPDTPSTNGSTPTGWTKEPSGVNAEYPYEWVSMRIQDKGVWGNYSKPTLWKDYSAMNANLLEQTDFDGLLTKWENRSIYQGTSYEDDSINHISNDGKDGVNCYYDISSRMKYESLYKDVLIQRLVNDSVTRLKPSTWYTLSFYAKCGVNVKPVNLTSNEYGFGVRVVYLEKGKKYKFSVSGRINSQAQNDGKSLRCYVYNGDWSWVKTIIIDSTSDTTKSIEFSDVPSDGTYQFRAYMGDNGGSRAGKVTLNWANVEEVDGELFSTYIYPSLVDNTKVFVDGEQKAVSSDCEVKYKASSSDWVRHTVTFKTRSTLGSKQNLLFRMLPIVMSDNTHYLKICMPKLEVGKVASAWQLNEADRKGDRGDNGKTGKPLAGPTMWDSSVWYMSGKGDDEAYQSIVINPKNQKQMYLCGYSHSGKEPLAETSTSSVDTCTEEKPWVQVPYQDFVATKVLFAEKSKIKNLQVDDVLVYGADGTVKAEINSNRIYLDIPVQENYRIPQDESSDVYVPRALLIQGDDIHSYGMPKVKDLYNAVILPQYRDVTFGDITIKGCTQSGLHLVINAGYSDECPTWRFLTESTLANLSDINRHTLWTNALFVCSDIQQFLGDYATSNIPVHNIDGENVLNNTDYIHGQMRFNGAIARFCAMLPGQTIHLVSQITDYSDTNGTTHSMCVWNVINASDYEPIGAEVKRGSQSNTFPTTYDAIRPNGVDLEWSDFFFAPHQLCYNGRHYLELANAGYGTDGLFYSPGVYVFEK